MRRITRNCDQPGANLLRKISWLTLGYGILCLTPTPAHAELDALRPLTRQLLRPEILIGVDTSGSMAWRSATNSHSGTDCAGDDAGSICGDGLCSGLESPRNCPTDCNIWHHYTSIPGSPSQCYRRNSQISRMWMTKRALRNILPELRTAGSFGLLTFKQTGYYPYSQAMSGTPRRVTIFLTEWELRGIGSWVSGRGWDTMAKRPMAGFTRYGTAYSLLSTTTSQSARHISRSEDSLYRADGPSGYIYRRFRWAQAGRRFDDGTNTWSYLGSYYTYPQQPVYYWNSHRYSSYRGPQFTSGGTTYVYNRMAVYNTGGIGGWYAGQVSVPLSVSTSQSAHDGQVGQILNRLNYAANGGVFASGGTPLGEVVQTAQAHYADRRRGVGRFSSPDRAAGCRQRYLLLLTDGQPNGRVNPVIATRMLYRSGGSNPIRTIVVGLPGLPSYARRTLDRIADMGDDGRANNSARALVSNNEKELVDNIKRSLYEALKGEYTTSAAGTATVNTGGTQINNNVALVASAELPGWKGHLRAIDTSGASPVELWDAGTLLANRSWTSRTILTGYPSTVGSGIPIPLFNAAGTVNLRGQAGSPKGVVDAWPGSPPRDSEITAMVKWLGGNGRDWKLDSFVRSVPATVGAPPSLRDVGDHATFETTYANRQNIVYAASTTGLLHAFDAKTGAELFAYLPPHLLPKVYALYKQGGQSDDPAEFSYVLASSPRVKDVRVRAGTWQTQLVLTDGPGGDNFVVLDITNPSTCRGNPVTCTVNTPPLRVISHSQKMLPSVDRYFGQTWSLPAMYFSYNGNNPETHAAMGSGYDDGLTGEGRYYARFSKLTPSWSSASRSMQTRLITMGATRVPFGLVADTAAAVDADRGLSIVATYQASLNGTITRFSKGRTDVGFARTIMNEGAGHPFYYAPAVLHRGGGQVTLTAMSGSFETNDPWMQNPGFVSKLMMRRESGGAIQAGVENITCRIDQVCNCRGVSVDGPCQAPSARALPITRSFLVDNSATGLAEGFFLYWDPPANACVGNKLAQGDSYLVRIGSNGTEHKLLQVKRFPNTLASGMTIMGGTTGFVLTLSGRGVQTSGVKRISAGRAAAVSVGENVVESWTEVQ